MSNVLIILTTTINVNYNKFYLFRVNPEERLNIYLKSIKQWLELTEFKIVVVENSGYKFDELNEYKEKYKDRFGFVSFNEKDYDIYTNQSKGISEMFSIQKAYYNSNFLNTCDFIIKVTGRYFIPDFYQYLLENNFFNRCKVSGNPIDRNELLILRQNHPERCEVVGCNKKIFNFIFNYETQSNIDNSCYLHIESVLYKRIQMINKDYIFVCKDLVIEPTVTGGGENYICDLL